MLTDTDHPTPTVPDPRVEAAARRLRAAANGPACAPVRDLIAPDDTARAYLVQRAGIADRTARGARIVGRKIGLTSASVQRQLGVDQPDFGFLTDDMAYAAGSTVPLARFRQPRVEAEVAFVLARDLTEGPFDVARIRGAVECVLPAIEICDSRIADWDISFADTVADNASAGGYVLGTTARTLDEVEPAAVRMRMTVTGSPDSTGSGRDCLGDPLLAVCWLAERALAFGAPLTAGQVILSGALGPMRPVAAGTEVLADLGALGTVGCAFA